MYNLFIILFRSIVLKVVKELVASTQYLDTQH